MKPTETKLCYVCDTIIEWWRLSKQNFLTHISPVVNESKITEI